MPPMASAARPIRFARSGWLTSKRRTPSRRSSTRPVVVVVLGVEPPLDLPGQPGQRGAVVLAVLRSIDLGPEPRQQLLEGLLHRRAP